MPDLPPNNRKLGRFMAMSQVGMEMVVPLGIGLIVDSYCGLKPWGLIVGTICGFVGGLAHLIVLANQKIDGKEESEDNKR